MEERLKTIIIQWLSSTFNNSKAMPKPMIDGLAEEINNHRWEIYNYVKDEYDLEDINMVAENNDIELTKEEESYALHRYRKAQEYDSSIDFLDEIIKTIKSERKKEQR